MITYIILAFFLGILAGTFTGLIPGIHINLVAIILLSFSAFLLTYFSPIILVVFIVAMAITHTFIDYLPSIFLGAPDEDTVLSILPGHEMLIYPATPATNDCTIVTAFIDPNHNIRELNDQNNQLAYLSDEIHCH